MSAPDTLPMFGPDLDLQLQLSQVRDELAGVTKQLIKALPALLAAHAADGIKPFLTLEQHRHLEVLVHTSTIYTADAARAAAPPAPGGAA